MFPLHKHKKENNMNILRQTNKQTNGNATPTVIATAPLITELISPTTDVKIKNARDGKNIYKFF